MMKTVCGNSGLLLYILLVLELKSGILLYRPLVLELKESWV